MKGYRPYVLYINQDETEQKSLKNFLEQNFSFHVDTSGDFLNGVKKASAFNYDAIISNAELFSDDAILNIKEMRNQGLFYPFIATYSEESGDILKTQKDIADFWMNKENDTESMYNKFYKFIEKSTELSKSAKQDRGIHDILPLVWNKTPVGLIIINSKTRDILGFNLAFIEIFGIENPQNIRFNDLFKDPNITDSLINTIEFGENQRIEADYDFDKIKKSKIYSTSKKGKLNLELILIPLNDKDANILIHVNDITNLKKAESRILLVNKELSFLTGITRHDVINQVSAVKLYAELLRYSQSDDDKAFGYLKAIEDCTGNIERLVNFSKDYENLGKFDNSWQDLKNMVLLSVSDVLKPDINLRIETGNCEIFTDDMMKFVFSSLSENSVRHGENVSLISVKFREDGDFGVISFEDNGVGVAKEDKERIFMKGVGKNTGYGLFFVKEILEFMGYSIIETGCFGKGARFEIKVPAEKWRYF